MQVTLPSTRPTPDGSSRFVPCESFPAEPQRAPSRLYRDRKVYARTKAVFRTNEYPPSHSATNKQVEGRTYG